MATNQAGERAPTVRSAEPRLAAVTARLARLWQRPGAARSSVPPPDTDWQQQLETLAARVEHLEAELEGLQDAVYRQSVLEQENISELRRRTAPQQLARELGQDAQRRGL